MPTAPRVLREIALLSLPFRINRVLLRRLLEKRRPFSSTAFVLAPSTVSPLSIYLFLSFFLFRFSPFVLSYCHFYLFSFFQSRLISTFVFYKIEYVDTFEKSRIIILFFLFLCYDITGDEIRVLAEEIINK